MMPRFNLRHSIQAIQWSGDNQQEIQEFIGNLGKVSGNIVLLNGGAEVTLGNWIAIDFRGNLMIYSTDEMLTYFKRTFT